MDILELLSPGKCISGENIARQLEISRAAVHKRVMKLRSLGYGIEGERNSGYRIVSRPDRLLPEEIRRHLDGCGVLLKEIQCLDEVTSTQVVAKELLGRETTTEWHLVVAEHQSNPYGRLGRIWEAPRGGIWFSFILKPHLAPEAVPPLTLVASLALCRTIDIEYGVRVSIKWPNDLVLENKKLAGVLTEMSAEVGRVNGVVIGIGLNANNPVPHGLKKSAVSLSSVIGCPVDRCRLIALFMREMRQLYGLFLQQGFGVFAREYNERSTLRGKDVCLENGGCSVAGRVIQVDTDGCLRLKTHAGRVEKIIIGDVTLRKNGRKRDREL